MAEAGHSAGEYISHHLQNLTVCKKDGAVGLERMPR